MTFTVKYRAIDGKMREECIEAASRSECVANCKAQGISPIEVTERNNVKQVKRRNPHREHKNQNTGDRHGFSSIGKYTMLVAGLFAMGIGIWAYLDNTVLRKKMDTPKVLKATPPKTKSSDQPKSAKRKPTKESRDLSASVLNVPNKPAYDPDFQANYPRTPGHLPLPGGNVVTFKPPAPGCTTEVFTVNGLYLCDSKGNFVKYEPPRLFDNRFENTLDNLAMNTQMLLTDHTKNFTDEEIDKYLARPITIEVDDPPDVVLRKTATAAMKDDIREFIKSGGSYKEYVDSLHGKIATERVLHREAMREMVSLLSEGDYEGAREYREKIDSFLSESGYLGLKLPDEWQKKLDQKVEIDAKDTSNE